MKLFTFQNLAMVFLSVTLAGCITTGYQPKGFTGGYTEQKIGPDTYKLSYLVNGNTPPQKALEHWNQRAAELCGSSDFKSDVKLSDKVSTDFMYLPSSGGYFTSSHWPLASGTLECGKSKIKSQENISLTTTKTQQNINLDMTKTQDVEFLIYLPTAEAADRITKALVSHGFSVKTQPSEKNNNSYCVVAKKSLIPTEATLAGFRLLFTDMANAEFGQYDGWQLAKQEVLVNH